MLDEYDMVFSRIARVDIFGIDRNGIEHVLIPGKSMGTVTLSLGIGLLCGIVTLTRLPRKNTRRRRVSRRSSYGIPPVHCFSLELAQCSREIR